MGSVGSNVGYYVSPLSQLLASQFEVSCLETDGISDFAKERLGYNALGSMAVAAAIFFTATHITGVLAVPMIVPLILAGGAAVSFYFASTIIDYEDDSVITTLRETFYKRYLAIKYLDGKGVDVHNEICELFPLLEEEHGIEHRNRYGLPFGNDFPEIFAFVRGHISFNEALAIHKGQEGGSYGAEGSYQFLPEAPTSWKELFFQEIAAMDIEEIVTNYDMDELREYGIINDEQKVAVDDLLAAQRRFTEDELRLRERIAIERRKFDAKKAQAEEEYLQLACHERIAWFTKSFIGRVGDLLTERESKLVEVNTAFLVQQQAIFNSAGVSQVDRLENAAGQQYLFEEGRYNADKERIANSYEAQYSDLESVYYSQVDDFLGQRVRARDAKEEKIAQFKRDFEEVTGELRQQLTVFHTASGYQEVKMLCSALFIPS